VAGLVVSAAWFVSVWSRVRDNGWVSAVPVVVLIAGTGWSDAPNGAIWHELESRTWSGELRGWQRSLLARRLASMLHVDDQWKRRFAVQWLGYLGTNASCAVPGLIDVAGSEVRHLRIVAVQAMGRILTDEQRCIPVLVGLLQDPDSEVRAKATWSLWQFASKTDADTSAAIPALTRALQDQHASQVVLTSRALSWILPDPQGVIPILRELLEHDDIQYRYACLSALADIADRSPEALMLLMRALGDSDSLIRESALHLLYAKAIGHVVAIPDSSRPRLKALAESVDSHVRQWAATMLALPRRSP